MRYADVCVSAATSNLLVFWKVCPICKGRGEVAAGITGNPVEYGPSYDTYDWRGNIYPSRAQYPTSCSINPDAWDAKNKCIWYLDPPYNGWGIALCMHCRGCGMTDIQLE